MTNGLLREDAIKDGVAVDVMTPERSGIGGASRDKPPCGDASATSVSARATLPWRAFAAVFVRDRRAARAAFSFDPCDRVTAWFWAVHILQHLSPSSVIHLMCFFRQITQASPGALIFPPERRADDRDWLPEVLPDLTRAIRLTKEEPIDEVWGGKRRGKKRGNASDRERITMKRTSFILTNSSLQQRDLAIVSSSESYLRQREKGLTTQADARHPGQTGGTDSRMFYWVVELSKIKQCDAVM